MHMKYKYLIIALFFRFFLILIGEAVDSLDISLKYTDIDYIVYTDAAKLVFNDKSPYLVETYRYTPYLAFLMIPNLYLPIFGKFIFSIVDIFLIVIFEGIINVQHRYSLSNRKVINWISFIWAINPLTSNIATRGSSDSISNALILLTILYTLSTNYVLAGLFFGAVIHFRIYPIIYIPIFAIHILLADSSNKNLDLVPINTSMMPSRILKRDEEINDDDDDDCLSDISSEDLELITYNQLGDIYFFLIFQVKSIDIFNILTIFNYTLSKQNILGAGKEVILCLRSEQ